jgi:hypothetical protein
VTTPKQADPRPTRTFAGALRRRAWWLVPIAANILLLAVTCTGYLNQSFHNNDTISYLRIAQYYHTGQFDLAVNGYWGVLISWIMAPMFYLTDDLRIVAQLGMAISSMLFLIGTLRVLVMLRLRRRHVLIAGVCVAAFSSTWAAVVQTADMLVQAVLLIGFGELLRLVITRRWWRAVTTGAVFGIAYYAKTPGLILGAGAIIGTVALRWMLRDRLLVAARDAFVAFVCLAAVVTPWLVVLTNEYGRFTISTAAEINFVVGNSPEARAYYQPSTFQQFAEPRQGRVTSWERPTEASRGWQDDIENAPAPDAGAPALVPTGRSLTDRVGVRLRAVQRNITTLRNNQFATVDALGLLFPALCFLVIWIRPRHWIPPACILALIWAYLPVHVGIYETHIRYFFGIAPIMLGGGLLLVVSMARHAIPGRRRLRIALRRVGIAVLVISFLWTPVGKFIIPGIDLSREVVYREAISGVRPWVDPDDTDASRHPVTPIETVIAVNDAIGRSELEVRSVASVNGVVIRAAMYLALMRDIPYYGDNPYARSADEIAASGADLIFVGERPDRRRTRLIQDLRDDPRFRTVALTPSFSVFYIVDPTAQTPQTGPATAGQTP